MDDSPSSLSIIQPSSAVRLDDDHPTPAAAAVLAKWEALQQAVEQATTIDDLKQIRDALSLLWVVAKKAKLGLKMQNDIAETKLRDERKAGELLRAMKENGERAKSGRPLLSHDMTIAPTLPDLGITGNQSSDWRRIASLPEAKFETQIAETKAAGQELTTAAMIRAAIQHQREALPEPTAAVTPAFPQGKFRCIVIDPPWPMKKIDRDVRPKQSHYLDYPSMSLAEMAALPVGDFAFEDGCHLYLWVTQKYLPAGLELMAGWGFQYQCIMTWVKPTGFTPYSWMYNTELVLFGRRGSLPLERLGLKLSFEAPSEGHSIKPDVFYERVALASPEPRLEMFARRPREAFTVWGNEV